MVAKVQVARLGPAGELTIPADIREAARLRAGDRLAVVVTERGVLLRAIDPDQAWFWTPEWQGGEREADAQIAAGDVLRFNSAEDLFAYLDSVPPRETT